MSGYTNDEYVKILRVKNARPFRMDVRITLAEAIDCIERPLQEDETPAQYRRRVAIARDELTRLLLRIQDGKAEG